MPPKAKKKQGPTSRATGAPAEPPLSSSAREQDTERVAGMEGADDDADDDSGTAV